MLSCLYITVTIRRRLRHSGTVPEYRLMLPLVLRYRGAGMFPNEHHAIYPYMQN
jgi:hypothetical protein